MTFARPEALPILFAAPLLALLFWRLDRARARRLARLVAGRPERLAKELGTGRRRARLVLFTGATLLALLAAVQPLWGETARPELRGADIAVCLDVSRSMLARDVAPSRLERAREELRALARRVAGDRLALVVFAGEARLAVPLTRDTESFAEMAALADPLAVSRGGTDLGAALDTALDALPKGGVILLLTDGEDLGGRGLRAARRCRERGVTVHCIGIGSERGAKIPVDGGFLRDRAGVEVVSALDPSTLRALAAAGGGEYTGPDLVGLYERRVLPLASQATAAEAIRTHENRFQWPLLAAFLLFLVEVSWSERRR